MRRWFENFTYFDADDAFYKRFDAAAPRDADPETSYEKWYRPLDGCIIAVAIDHGVPVTAMNVFDDWVPNCTRHLTIESRFLTPALLAAIHGLLIDDYAKWRIEVIVVGTLRQDDTRCRIALWNDRVLATGDPSEWMPTDDRRP